MTHSTALSAWEMMVASAADHTPQRSTATNSRSSTTLVREETIRKYSGRLLSPSAFMMPVKVLYITPAPTPAK